MKKIIYLIFLLLAINLVLAQDIEVVKESLQEIKLNDIIEIKIHISNPSSAEKEFSVIENLPQDIEVIDPIKVFIKRNDALEIKYYEWIVKVPANKIETINYKIKPLSLGQYLIGSTEITDKSNLKIYESNSITFNVKCTPNNKCENNENSITCPEDCNTGISDGICNYKADGICDPDCNDEPDCKKSEVNINYFIAPFIIIIVIILLIWLLPKIFKKRETYKIEK
jgi:hypothetical protein